MTDPLRRGDDHDRPADRPTDVTHPGAPDDHAGPTRAIDPGALAQGHEPDVGRDVRAILEVPLVMVSVMAICFLTIWGVFSYFSSADRRTKPENPLAAEQGQQPLNQRLSEVQGPRVEGLRRRDEAWQFYRSTQESRTGNSPEFYPEQILPENVPALSGPKAAYRWTDRQAGRATIPVEAAIKIAVQKNLLPVAPNAVDPNTVPSSLRTREGNSGLGPAGEGAK
jgi:hypothetical protein